jgi:hypothetical protein
MALTWLATSAPLAGRLRLPWVRLRLDIISVREEALRRL